MKHEATSTNDVTKTPDPVIPSRPSGRFAIGNRLRSLKREADIRAMKLGRMVVKNLSPNNYTIRLPPAPSEVMATSPTTNSTTVTTPRDDPPESHSSLDDAPELWRNWERKTSEELSSESPSTSQSSGIESDSQPSPENRNDIISCVLPGSVRSVTEPDAIAGRLLQSKHKHMPQSPPPFSDVSDISPVSSDEGFKPPDPHEGSLVPIHHEHSSPEVFPNAYITSTVPRGIRSPVNENVVQYVEPPSLLTLTADSADVASLVRNSVTGPDDYAEYYWVGDLPLLVVQSHSPLFTPSPGQLFSFHIDRIYDSILGDASLQQRTSRGSVLSDLYSYFMKDGFAISWADLISTDASTLAGHILTMSVCMWKLHGLEVMEHQSRLLALTASVIDALQSLSDQEGLSHSMSPTSPPRILERHFTSHVIDLADAIERRADWRIHLDTRVNLIGQHFVSGGYSHWPMMHNSWWNMSQAELMGTHTMLTSSELELAEQKVAARQVASTSTKTNDDDANSGNINVVPITRDDTQKSSGPSASSPPEIPLIDATPLEPPLPSPPQVEAFGRNHSGDTYRGDPMEPLDYPETIPPRGENHFLGRFVALFDDKGKLVKLVWVRYRRNLMVEIPSNCPTDSAHWLQVFNQRDGSVIGSIPTPGMRRSVVFPGDKVQSYPEDPSFVERMALYAPSTHVIDPPLSIRTDLPMCGGQVFAGNRIRSTPHSLSQWKKPPASISTRSSQSSTRSDMTRSVNAIVPYPQDWGNVDATSPQNLFLANPTPVSDVAQMPAWSRRGRRGEIDSSDDEESTHSRAARRIPGKPYIPPVTKDMAGGADPYITTPGGTRRPRTRDEVTSMIMVAFKPKLDPKQFLPFKDEGRWIQWWNHFVITLCSQGMGTLLDMACAAREPEEALGFVRMQDYGFGVLNDVIQTPAAKSILRQY